MDADERRAAFAEARAESLETLERVADIEVRERDYSKPDALEEWRRGMLKPEPEPQRRKLTDAESARWRAYIDGRVAAEVAAALAERDERWVKIVGETVIRLRREISEQVGLLRAEFTIERATNGDNARIINVPAFIGKRDAVRS